MIFYPFTGENRAICFGGREKRVFFRKGSGGAGGPRAGKAGSERGIRGKKTGRESRFMAFPPALLFRSAQFPLQHAGKPLNGRAERLGKIHHSRILPGGRRVFTRVQGCPQRIGVRA